MIFMIDSVPSWHVSHQLSPIDPIALKLWATVPLGSMEGHVNRKVK